MGEKRRGEAEESRAAQGAREAEDREAENRDTAQIVGRLTKVVRTLEEAISELPAPEEG